MATWEAGLRVLVTLTFCLLCADSDSQEIKMPPYVEVCYQDDPTVADCIRRNIEKLPPLFKSGSKDFDLEPLEPITYHNLTFVYDSPLIGGKAMLPTSYQSGLTNLQVLDVRPQLSNPNKFILDFDLHFPHLNIKSDYKMSGNIFTFPVKMNGNIDAHFEDVNITYHMVGNTKTIEDRKYLILNTFKWRFIGDGIGRSYLANDDLVEGYPTINKMAKNIVATSWKQLHRHITPAVLRETEPNLKDMFIKFFRKYPYDVLLPKSRKVNRLTK